MSASPVARQATNCQNIPSRRVVLHDPSQLPHDYSTTPGGTLFSTTPGGSKGPFVATQGYTIFRAVHSFSCFMGVCFYAGLAVLECTRIVYERSFMLNLRNSPLSRTPPKNFDTFPDTMVNGSPMGKSNRNLIKSPKKVEENGDQKRDKEIDDNQEQFQMDM